MSLLYTNQDGQEPTVAEAYREAQVLVILLGDMLPASCRDLPLPEMYLHFEYKEGTSDTVLDCLYLTPDKELET